MWILHICHSYYPPFLDCARQYAALFKDTPYQVLTVYLTGQADANVIEGSQSDEVIFLGYDSEAVSGLKINAIRDVRALAKQRTFAFCIAHRVKPTYVALLATNLPVVSVHHNYNDYQRWSRRWLVNLFQSRLLMLGVSDSVRDDLRADLKSWNPEKIQTLYNRIDVGATTAELFTKFDAREQLSLPQEAWVVGNVGRLHHDKDQATLLRGFALALPNLPEPSLLVVIGEGPLAEKLKQLAQDLAIQNHVMFLGKVANAKRYFRAFDVFALTSDHEPFGMVLLEALAANLPIICSDCGGGAEVVRDIGELFVLGDANDLSHALQKVSQNKQPQTDLGLKKLVNQFSDTAVKEAFWEMPFIKSVTKKGE